MAKDMQNRPYDKECISPLLDIYDGVWNIERELNVLDRAVDNTYFWPIIRVRMFDMLFYELGYSSFISRYRSSFPSAAKIFSPLAGRRGRADWEGLKTADTVLAPFLRRQKRGGNDVDIFSEKILHEEEFGRFLVLERDGYSNLAERKIASCTVLSRDYYWARVMSLAIPKFPWLVSKIERQWRELSSAFERRFKIKFPLSVNNIALRVAAFDAGRHLAKRFFEHSSAKRFFFVASQGSNAIAAAAQDCGVPAFEFQHGMISKFQASYHYPGSPHVPYAPNAALLFGEYWKSAADWPINTRTIVIGSSNLPQYMPLAANKKKRQVFILSQGSIGKYLFPRIIEAARLAPEWIFIYRLHPSESLVAYQDLISVMGGVPSNLRTMDASTDMYEMLARSEVQIGVYSTAMFEGMALGVRTIVFAQPFSEHMAQAIASGDAVLAHSAEDIAALLSSAPRCRKPEKYYAPPVHSIADILS